MASKKLQKSPNLMAKGGSRAVFLRETVVRLLDEFLAKKYPGVRVSRTSAIEQAVREYIANG